MHLEPTPNYISVKNAANVNNEITSIDRRVHSIPECLENDWDNARNASKSKLIHKVYSRGTYSGELNHLGRPNGRGIMAFNDGSIYEGDWNNSVMCGQGTCTFSDGVTEYSGEWKNGSPDGKGCFLYSNGDRYDGFWENGLMEGLGVYVYHNSEVYDGRWKRNKPHGHGRFIYRNGNIYEGQWLNGKRDGNGILKQKNGDEFAGEYIDDKKEGLGVYRRTNGEIDIGVYSDYLHSEGVRFSEDRKKGWRLNSDGTTEQISITEAQSFRENACIVSPFLAHYIHEYC